MKTVIAVNVDTQHLPGFEDEYLASLWHLAHINPAPEGQQEASEMVEAIGREIIRRWLPDTNPPLWDREANITKGRI